jgi:hypothetical protein
MPTIELIDPTRIPPKARRADRRAVDRGECFDALRRAHQEGKALKINVPTTRRAQWYVAQMRRAAKILALSVHLIEAELRDYTSLKGRARREAGVLYVVIVDASRLITVPATPAPRSILPPWETPPKAVLIPPAPFEKTSVPGLERSR